MMMWCEGLVEKQFYLFLWIGLPDPTQLLKHATAARICGSRANSLRARADPIRPGRLILSYARNSATGVSDASYADVGAGCLLSFSESPGSHR